MNIGRFLGAVKRRISNGKWKTRNLRLIFRPCSHATYCKTALPARSRRQELCACGQVVEPSPRHISFDGVAEIDLEHGHSIGLDVERGMREGVYACEAVQVPADEHKVEGRRIADEHGSAGQASQPVEII